MTKRVSHADGTPVRGAAATDGVAIGIAEQRKRRRYPELLSSREARLVVLACETGGRWSDEAVELVQDLAQAKARSAPEALRASVSLGWQRRWSTMLAVACQSSLAATLLGSDPWAAAGRDGYAPSIDMVLDGGQLEFSRLPAARED